MKTTRLVSRLVLSGALLLLSSFAAFAQDNLVVPGKSVGSLRLGDVRDAALNTLGKPTRTQRLRSGLLKDSWLGPEPPSGSEETQIFLHVIYRARRVVQIEFNDPKYKTAGGISIGSTLAEFRAQHKRPRVRAYVYDDGEGSGYVGYYYDAVTGGIAFSFGTQDNFDANTISEALRIHAPGVPVIPDPGGKPTPANDERPVEKPKRRAQHASNTGAGQSQFGEVQRAIEQFWDALGQLDGEGMKRLVDWPVMIVEASNFSNKLNVLHTVSEFDEELKRGPSEDERKSHQGEFYGARPLGFSFKRINQNLISVSYVCRMPRAIRDASGTYRVSRFNAQSILRYDLNDHRWKIIFITVPK